MNQRQKQTGKPAENSKQVADDLLRKLRSRGYKSAIVSVARLKDLEEDIDERNQTGQFAPELYDERLRTFSFGATSKGFDARSVVIAAIPQPHIRLRLYPNGRPLSVIIPPTYSTRVNDEVEHILSSILKPAGHKFFRRRLPLKLLAVRSGLALYGRNNLAYVEGMGSYCRLVGFCISLPIEDHLWIEPQQLPECHKCVACIKKCPTHAISRDRFLIRAEQCLTFHNERAIDFPTHLRPEWHHCLIGCLFCQACCPVNKKINGGIEEVEPLNEHDSTILLNGGPLEEFSESVRRFMVEFEFDEQLSQLSRNLRALLDSPDTLKHVERLLPVSRA